MGDCGRFDPIIDTELPEDVRDVDARSLAGDEQRVGDLLVRAARGEETEDLQLSLGQPRAAAGARLGRGCRNLNDARGIDVETGVSRKPSDLLRERPGIKAAARRRSLGKRALRIRA